MRIIVSIVLETSIILLVGPSNAIPQTFAPSRQVHFNETTRRDEQHLVTQGRQIAYGGIFNPGCDYVYMVYNYRKLVGSDVQYHINLAIFDWAAGTWQGSSSYEFGTHSYGPCIAAKPINGHYVFGHFEGEYNQPRFTHIKSAGGCFDSSPTDYLLAGPPNTWGINTGDYGDNDATTSPYVWPKVALDTSAGAAIMHVAASEYPICGAFPEDSFDVSSLLYYRYTGGTWQGPYFMDSSYLYTPLVLADHNSSDVYYAYLKPLYYHTTIEHPCPNRPNNYFETCDVVYRKSTDDGLSWGPVNHVTDFWSGFTDGITEPAAYDLTGMVDPTGTLHLAWATPNRNPDNPCDVLKSCKLWHWDSSNDCISLAYDASRPKYFASSNPFGKFNLAVAKPNISWCDNKLYITFTRFGGNPVWDTSFDYSAADKYENGEIFVVASDASGSMGGTWTEAINLTQTTSESCAAGDCFSEHWSSSAMYSNDSLMILYIEDKNPGSFYADGNSSTVNPVMFMTWPCFSMMEVEQKVSYVTYPETPIREHIALSPYGSGGCVNPGNGSGQIELVNTGNVSLNYSVSSDADWLTITSGSSGSLNAGSGPRGSSDFARTGAPGCASSAFVEWSANSSTLNEGIYLGGITVDFQNPLAGDLYIRVCAYVNCEFKKAWTFMVYLNADNNLEKVGIDDMNEMEKIGSSDLINIVVQMDRHPRSDSTYDGSNGDWPGTKRFYVEKDYDRKIINSEGEDIGEQDMGDPATLYQFANWCKDNYESEYYALVIWNHGSGFSKSEE